MSVAVPGGVEAVSVPFPGIVAFTTTRDRGDFNIVGERPSGEIVQRWLALQEELGVARFVYARQVHGDRVVVHNESWTGWLRVADADGHVTFGASSALAVTLADCVPIFLSHPNGVIALLHAGWRGTAARIVDRALDELSSRGVAIESCHAHLGPAICGECYEVGAEVIQAVLGERVEGPTRLDLRAALGAQFADRGVTHVTKSPFCTRCNNARFFSHRAGDVARHIGVIARIA